MKFILTRHTTTDWNLAGRIQGQTDTELNEQGRKEAISLTKKLLGFNISRIISSDLKRSKQTAEIINFQLKVSLILEKDLRECSFGSIEGMTREEAIKKYGASIIKHWDDQYKSYDFSLFGGENRNQVLGRHIRVLKKYSDTSKEIILLVGHGRGLSTLLSELEYPPTLQRGEYRAIDRL